MLPREITGLCNVQHKNIGMMVIMAQKAGKLKLFPENALQPEHSPVPTKISINVSREFRQV